MKLKFLLGLLIVSSSVFAQREIGNTTSLKDRGYVGVGFGGLSFGESNYYGRYFSIGVSALTGYMVTANLSAGLGFDYQFDSYGDADLKNHIFGGYPFIRYNIADFFVQADYDVYSLKALYDTQQVRVTEERFFVGVGYSPQSFSRTRLNALLSYDFLYDNIGLFSSPISLRVFVTFH